MLVELLQNEFLILLIFALFFQFLFFFALFSRLAFYKRSVHSDQVEQGVSVIICAKNEEENLREYINSFLGQDYPEFEIIVVDDQSEDGTYDFLKEKAKQNDKLKVVTVGEHIKDHIGKKLALTLGIRKAKYEIILLSDADCKPDSFEWISKIVSHYSNDIEIVLGFSPYQWKNSLLNILIQFDAFFTAIQYFSFSLAGMTYMGVGRNLSYRKELFYKRGFASHLHVPYGDDDLFVNENAKQFNVAIEIDKKAFVYTQAHTKFNKWFKQKKRHLKGGIEYKRTHRFWLSALWLSYFAFFALLAASLIINPSSYVSWTIFVVRTLSAMLIYSFVAFKLKQKKLIWFMPLLEIIYILIILPLFGFIASFSNKKYW
ncbi:MAG: glycosyltransferase [Bacteroidetes bacterium]|nr:glycosyltransferase [Bacteroidota bacterium]MBL6962717.1 glycosyltransferase [Bacteroidota bacterium]